MPELLRFKTAEFECSIWANDVSRRQVAHQSALGKRDVTTEACKVLFAPPLQITPSLSPIDKPCSLRFVWSWLPSFASLKAVAEKASAELTLRKPVFYENTQYHVEWVFFVAVDDACIEHRSQRVNEAFRFIPARNNAPARLTGVINTGNDVGWLCLPMRYEVGGIKQLQRLSFEVLPTKMCLHNDLPAMYQAIDQAYPLWRFSLVEKTEQAAQRGQTSGRFPLMWLASFAQLREQFEQGLKVIAQAPHRRLQSQVASVKAARLKGKVSNKLGERVQQDVRNGRDDCRYRVEKKTLSVDTPENRFIKAVVMRTQRELARLEEQLRHANEAPDRQRLSDAFLDELSQWQPPLKSVLSEPFFAQVGTLSALSRESLVLQQKTGYSAVYRVWQELKFYLDVFAGQSRLSMKSVAEIYEVWCFLQLKNLLQVELGFELLSSKREQLNLNEFFEYQLKDGLAGAFEFHRADGVRARLAHEPRFYKGSVDIRSYATTQAPDIVLEVTLPKSALHTEERRFIWLFDAKYRIKMEKGRFDEDDIECADYVPDDALNQMHRYRDALIRLGDAAPESLKSRPTLGAFALYPGYFDQEKVANPYAGAIEQVGIGAFALLPCQQGSTQGHAWLLAFLRDQIGLMPSAFSYSTVPLLAERLYVQESARIPYSGMQQVLYPDLTLTTALGEPGGREPEYFDAFAQGTAQWYHMPTKTFEARFKQHVAREIRYLALLEGDAGARCIKRLWPVKSVQSLPRQQISAEQAGKSSTDQQPYYLFELGKPLTLSQSVVQQMATGFTGTMRLTTVDQLTKAASFEVLEGVYREALKNTN